MQTAAHPNLVFPPLPGGAGELSWRWHTCGDSPGWMEITAAEPWVFISHGQLTFLTEHWAPHVTVWHSRSGVPSVIRVAGRNRVAAYRLAPDPLRHGYLAEWAD
jgi:hypothetical protein